MVRDFDPFEISLKYSCMMRVVPQKGGEIASLPWCPREGGCWEKRLEQWSWDRGTQLHCGGKKEFLETSLCGSALGICEQSGVTIPKSHSWGIKYKETVLSDPDCTPQEKPYHQLVAPGGFSLPLHSAWLLKSTSPLSLPGTMILILALGSFNEHSSGAVPRPDCLKES